MIGQYPFFTTETLLLFIIILGIVLLILYLIFHGNGRWYTSLPSDLCTLTYHEDCKCYKCIQYRKEKKL